MARAIQRGVCRDARDLPAKRAPRPARNAPSPAALTISLATAEDRTAIYRIRHAVYAVELKQHAPTADGALSDPLDDFNHYIVATSGKQVIGFISLTPPGHGRYSIDKYLNRAELPFACDDGLYEVRILTVTQPFRGSRACALLMYAALRWVEAQGGSRIIAIGRSDLLGLYRKAGFRALNRRIESGALTFELMTQSVADARRLVDRRAGALRTLYKGVDWRLPMPFGPRGACYHGGAFFEAIGVDFTALDRRTQIINADVLDAWFPPTPKVLTALRNDLGWILRTSPPNGCEGMVQAIAAARAIPAACVVPGAGSSDLIFLALREWLKPSSRVLILDPTYGEYAHLLERVIGCRVDRLRLSRDTGYGLDLGEFEARIGRNYDLVVLVNPNNPTGRHVPRADLEAVLSGAPASTRIWVDEAYVDYVGAAESLERFAAFSQNVVVCKSMSKAYALSGVRVGYLCAPASLAAELLAVRPPWAVGLPGQIAAVGALGDDQYYHDRYRQTHELRDQLAAELGSRCGLDVMPGTANYLLCHLPSGRPGAAQIVARCRARGLFIRDVSSMSDRGDINAVRIAVKEAAVNRRIVEILDEALSL